jgi:hypothetical protein
MRIYRIPSQFLEMQEAKHYDNSQIRIPDLLILMDFIVDIPAPGAYSYTHEQQGSDQNDQKGWMVQG